MKKEMRIVQYVNDFIFKLWLRFIILIRTNSISMACNYGRQDYEIVELEDFLTNEECDILISITKRKDFIQSTISNGKGQHLIDSSLRKSTQCWFDEEEHPLIKRISEKIQSYIPLPLEHQEAIQIVKYEENDFYKRHYDTPYHNDAVGHFNKFTGPRVATFLIYLNDDFEGGETDFVLANKTVIPKKGKAIIFYNIDINLTLIPESIHVGRKIIRGEKWIANKWIRVWPFRLHHTLFNIQQNSWMMKLEKKT